MTFFLARHGATYNQPKNVAFFWQLLVVFLLNLLRMEKNFICNARKTEISPPWGPPGVALTPSPWRGGSCLSLSFFGGRCPHLFDCDGGVQTLSNLA